MDGGKDSGIAGWLADVRGLDALAPDARDLITARARLVELPKGAHAFVPGADCNAYLLVLKGSVRVQLLAENGREIVLYRVHAGESCVLTTSCLLTREPYAAEAVAEDDVTAAALPVETFRTLLATSTAFRDFVLAAYADRVADLIFTMEDAVFHRIDRRLARALIARGGASVAATHQELAAELGSAREVVTRQLRSFERQGLVATARGRVDIRDRAGLARLAAESE